MAQENINDKHYEDYYRYEGRSKWMEKIWVEAFGDEYPKGLDIYGYVTKTDLKSLIRLLHLSPGDIFLDIGCGKGGPGFHISQETGAKFLGIDKIAGAVEQARKFAAEFTLKEEPLFHVGEFYNIPLDDSMVDRVLSVDAFWTATDKLFALREVKRVLKPGGRFVFTNWDIVGQDLVSLFEESGLSLVSREETIGWRTYQEKVYDGAISHAAELRKEMGAAAEILLYEAQASMPWLHRSVRRIYVLEKSQI